MNQWWSIHGFEIRMIISMIRCEEDKMIMIPPSGGFFTSWHRLIPLPGVIFSLLLSTRSSSAFRMRRNIWDQLNIWLGLEHPLYPLCILARSCHLGNIWTLALFGLSTIMSLVHPHGVETISDNVIYFTALRRRKGWILINISSNSPAYFITLRST